MWGAIIAGVGMLMGAGSSGQAATQAKRTASINANLTRSQSGEEMRRLETDIAQTEGLASALSAASGVQVSGSREISIEGVKKENRAQLEWLRKSGVQKADVIQRGGQLAASQLKSQAQMQTVQGFGQIAQGLYGNYNTGS